jgi:hypothetical protein
MKQLSNLLIVAALLSVALPGAHAAEKPRVSPHETVNATIDGAEIKIVYGRPYTKDPKTGEARKIWGGLVPFGKVWRTGADEATVLITTKALDFGGTALPAGSYSLFTVPEENGGKLIINKQTGQWGTKYDEKQDLAKVDLTKVKADAPADQFTITLDKNSAGGGTIKLIWENAAYSVNFSVKK